MEFFGFAGDLGIKTLSQMGNVNQSSENSSATAKFKWCTPTKLFTLITLSFIWNFSSILETFALTLKPN